MRWAWIRPGTSYDPTKAKAWGLERVIFDANDPQIKAVARLGFPGATYSPTLTSIRNDGMGVGITRSPDWDTGLYAGAVRFAEKMTEDLTDLGFGPNTGPASCAVILNRETPHDAKDQLAMLKRWRELRPTRVTAWAVEPMQGGWVGDFELSGFIANDPNLVVVGELYLGTPRMYPVSERRVVDNLKNPGGIPEDRIKAYYDAELKVPWGWDGVIFDFAKLPAKPETGL